jgi:hypothetical protein
MIDSNFLLRPTMRQLTRLLSRAAALATLALLVAAPAGAPARVASPHGSAATTRRCSTAKKSAARRSRRPAKHACAKHHSHKSHATHKPKKPAKTGSAAVELVPAGCEDGTLPSHSGGGAYSCEDGSAPSCEEGTLVHAAATTAPMCAVKPVSGEHFECSLEGARGCSTVEFACEDPTEGEASTECERGSEEEAEAPEPEEE